MLTIEELSEVYNYIINVVNKVEYSDDAEQRVLALLLLTSYRGIINYLDAQETKEITKDYIYFIPEKIMERFPDLLENISDTEKENE